MPQCNSIISIAYYNNALENTTVWLNFLNFFQIQKTNEKQNFVEIFRIIRDPCDFIPIDSYEIHRR